jgi:protein-disulfide isomerase
MRHSFIVTLIAGAFLSVNAQAVDLLQVYKEAQLDANQKLMQQLGSSATPTVFYKDASGNLQKIEGAPSGDMLVMVLGPR